MLIFHGILLNQNEGVHMLRGLGRYIVSEKNKDY